MRDLAHASVDQIQISVHALSAEALQTLYPSGYPLDVLLTNLQYLQRARPDGLRVQLNFVDTGANATELPAVQKLADDLGFDLYYRRRHSRGGQTAYSGDADRSFRAKPITCSS